MRHAAFARAPLAMAVGAALSAPASAALFEEAAPSFTVRATGDDFAISGFDLTALPDDRFAVLWTETGVGQDRLRLQRFDVDGNALAAPLTVREEPVGASESMGLPSLAADDQGNLVASWHEQPYPSYVRSCRNTLWFTRIDSGDTLATPIQVPGTDEQLCASDMDVDGDGDVALAWTADSGDGRSQQFATYDATSTPLGDGTAAGDGSGAAVALNDDGTLMVVWSAMEAQAVRVLGRRFALNGSALGDAFRLDNGEVPDTPTLEDDPTVVHAGDGGFVVQWLDHLSNPPEGYQAFVVQARHWGSDGAPGAALEMVNRTAGPSQALTAPSLAADDDGALVSAWGFESAGDPPEARATAFDANGDLVGERATLVETLPEDETFFGNEGTPKVALSKDLAAMAWYNDGGDTLQARVAPRLDLTPPDGGDGSDGGSDGGSGGVDDDDDDHLFGGAGGPLALAGLALLALRRRLHR